MSTEYVKVPFYREADGTKTFFFPNCRLKGGYEIGRRDVDKERYIQNYWEALAKVMAMSNPRFRRRNKNGIAGTVKCEPDDVEEVRRSFLEAERLKAGG